MPKAKSDLAKKLEKAKAPQPTPEDGDEEDLSSKLAMEKIFENAMEQDVKETKPECQT